MKIIVGITVVLVAILLLGWAGLHIQFKPFSPYSEKTGAVQMVPLPSGLPDPVDRFYHKIYGYEVPLITSAVITGKLLARPAGPMDILL